MCVARFGEPLSGLHLETCRSLDSFLRVTGNERNRIKTRPVCGTMARLGAFPWRTCSVLPGESWIRGFSKQNMQERSLVNHAMKIRAIAETRKIRGDPL
jgi:hypothetical protein